MYLNERERLVDKRLAALERAVLGRVMGPDGTNAARDKAEAERRKLLEGAPTPYQPPKPGVNRGHQPKPKVKG